MGILSGSDENIEDFKKLEEEIYKIYLKRKHDSRRTLGLNVIDLIIEDDNSRPEGSKWTKREIIANLVLFFAVGSDSPIKVIDTTVHYLSHHEEL